MKTNFNIQKNIRNSHFTRVLSVMKKLQSLGLIVIALLIGSSQVWGDTYSVTVDQNATGNNNVHITTTTKNSSQTVTYNNVSWTFAWAGNGVPNSGSRSQCQFGTGSYPCTSVTISTSGISGTITEVAVTTYGASSNNAEVEVTVGGTNFTNGGNTTVAIGTSSSAKTFTHTGKSGEIVITISQSTSKAIYVSGISVTYSSGPTLYTVTFDANGGSVTPASATQASVDAAVTLPTPTRDGYNCTGWYTATSGGTKRGDAGGSYTPTASETIHAQWSEKTYRNYRTLCATTDPSLSVSPASLDELDYIVGSGPSTAKSFSMSGSNLESGTLTVTAPENFQVSKASGSGWANNITFTGISGTLAATTVFVRLAADKSAGEYDGNVAISGCGLESAVQVAVSGTVYQPTIIADPASVTGWNAVTGSAPSPATQTIDVTGVNLKADISVSLTNGSDYFSIDKSSFEQTSGSASGTITISVKAAAYASAATRNGNIRMTSTDATTVDVPISLVVQDDPREKFELLTSSNISNLSDGAKLVLVEKSRGYVMNTTTGNNGHEQVNTGFEFLESNTIIALETSNVIEVLTLVASEGGTYLLKTLNNQYIYYSSGNTHKTGALPSPVTDGYRWTISMFPEDNYVKIKSTNCLAYNSGASGQKFRSYAETTITGSYDTYAIYAYYQPSNDPSISLTANLNKFEYIYGSGPSSPAQTFTVSGKNLNNNLVVSVPSAAYEVSKNGSSDWGSSVSYTPSTGTVSSQTVYIRLKAGLNANAHNYAAASGLRVTSTGATERNAALEGEVKYSVNISPNNDSYGNVSPSSETTYTSINITATPKANYRVPTTGGYIVTSGTATVVNNGDGTFTITPASNCVVTINFEAIPTHKVTYWATGTKVQESEVREGAAIPDQTTETASAIEAYCGNRNHFVGWTTTPGYSHKTDAPEGMITTMSPGGTMSTSDVDYYAVFANTGGTSTSFSRVTSLSQLADGDVIVIVSGSSNQYILEQTSTSITAGGIQTATTSITNSNSAQQWTLEASGSDWKLCKDASNKLTTTPGYSAYGNTLTIENSYSENYFFIRSSGGTSYLEYYSGWKFWSTDDPSGNNGNIRNAIYKQDPGYIDYTTECCSLKPVENVTINGKTNTSVTIEWTLPSTMTGITKFQVIDVDNGNNVVVDDISTSATSATISDLTRCNTYHYKVVSYSDACSVSSSTVEAQPFGDVYTVTFNYHEGTGSPASFTTSCSGSSTTLPSATRDGYTFLGWWTAADGGSKVGDAEANYDVTATTTVHAHWTQNYSVKYDRVGGTAACSDETCGAGLSYTVCSTEPTKSGYNFGGWSDGVNTYAAGATFTMPAANVTLTAQWTANWRNLTFNVPTGGGSISGGPAGSHVLDNHTFTFPTITGIASEKWCWTFLGWTETAPNGSGTWATTPSYIAGGATSSAITSDKTYYAVYSKTGAGASGDVECDAAAITAIGTGGGHAYNDAEWTITAADLSSWKARAYVGNKGTYLQIKEDAAVYIKLPTVGGNYTSITLNHNSNSGSRTIAYRTATDGSDVATTTTAASATSTTISIANGSTTGYIMSKSGTTTYQITSITAHFGPPAVYAHTLDDCPCVVTEFDLTYDANTANFPGSTISCENVTGYAWADHDEQYTFCSAPTLEGYRFLYWSENANGSGKHWNAGETVTCLPSADLTVYAYYERVYTVTFNNQGTPTPVTQGSAGAAIDVPAATTPCSAEWAFVGWSETAIAPMSMLPSLEITAGTGTYTPDEDVTLYAIYRKTSTSSAFVAGMSGAYKIKATYNGTDQYAIEYNGAKLRYSATPGDALTYYIKYVAADGGKYTIQQSDGQYIKYQGKPAAGSSGAHTDLALSATEYFWRISADGSLWAVQATTSTDANTRYLQFDPSGTGFKGYTNGINIAFVAAEGQYYYRTMSCDDNFDIIFHKNGTTINWTDGHPEASYKDLTDGTVIDVFPTASFEGWSFLGWRTADYEESTTAPVSSGVYGGTNGASGNTITVASANIDLYPVFTRFEDNEPFDQINGGDYHIYFIQSGSDDGYGGEKRVYAKDYVDNKRYYSTALCEEATEFTFTKLENGNWTIKDKKTGNYLYGEGSDEIKQRASATNSEWTLTVSSGNQFDAYYVGNDYGQLIAQGNGTSATFMNYRRTNTAQDGYNRVYLGSCTNRTFTTNPSTTPEIDLKGTATITASQNGAVRATNVLTVSGHNLTPSTGEISITSDNSDVYFSLSTDKNFAKGVADQPKTSVTITANGSGIVVPTPVYVHYKPSSNTDAVTDVTITASYTGAEDAEVTAEVRSVKENFVIASKIGGNWYALPANMSAEGVHEPVLIEVDESSKIAYGPATAGYKMWPVQTVNGGTDRYAANGDKVRFAGNSNAGLWASNSNNHIRDWAAITAIGSTAETPVAYEWIIETEDREAYTLKSAYNTNYLDLYRPSSGANAGKLVWATNGTYETNEVHFFPLEEREVITIFPREWKTTGLVYSVAADNRISAVSYKIGTGSETATTYTRHSTGGYGLYEVVLPDLTSQYGKLLTLKMTIDGVATYATTTIPIIVNADKRTKTDEPFATLSAETKDYDVVVLDGNTLTTDAASSGACKFQNLYLYAGSTLVNSANNNLSVRYLELRGGIKGIDHKSDLAQGVPHLMLGKNFSSTAGANLDMVVNTAHSYALSVPFDVSLADVNFANFLNPSTNEAVAGALDAQFLIMEYDGEQRATTGGTGWKHITSTSRTLHAGEGYVLQAKRPKGQPFGVIRFPFSSVSSWADGSGEVTKSAISISAHEGGAKTPDNDKGWNLIANPYMANVSYVDQDESSFVAKFTVGQLIKTDTNPWDGKYQYTDKTNAYVTIPNDAFSEFPQYRANTVTFEPFKNFFIQASADGNVTFERSYRAAMPRYLMAESEKAEPVYADINLTHDAKTAQAGITIDANAAEGYKFGEDQNIFESREALTYLKMYTIADGHYLVGNTLTPTEAEQLIPLEFYAPDKNGEYVFSLSETSDIEQLEYVMLYDAEGSNTDLLHDTYTIVPDKEGLIENRFRIGIRAKKKEDTATGIEPTGGGDKDRPLKFLYRDKMYILRNGVIYDATGKRVSNN